VAGRDRCDVGSDGVGNNCWCIARAVPKVDVQSDIGYNPPRHCGVEQRQLVGLITQRSKVRILPPLPEGGWQIAQTAICRCVSTVGEVAQWQSRGLISPWLAVQIRPSPSREASRAAARGKRYSSCRQAGAVFDLIEDFERRAAASWESREAEGIHGVAEGLQLGGKGHLDAEPAAGRRLEGTRPATSYGPALSVATAAVLRSAVAVALQGNRFDLYAAAQGQSGCLHR
jgi:hypothetical protein